MSEKVSLTIDERTIAVDAGIRLLWAALDNDIYIPHLCAVREEKRPNASCRLCFVEIEGASRPVASCSKVVEEGMVVKTRSDRVDRLVKTAFELLLSDHDLNCRSCPANRHCALQQIAKKRGIKLKQDRFKPVERSYTLDDSPQEFAFDRGRCVRCGRCVWADRFEAEVGAIGFTNRGIDRIVSTFNDLPLADSICTQCKLCVEACPVGALFYKSANKT